MTDFFRSLDRALEEPEGSAYERFIDTRNRYWAHEPVEAAAPLGEGWQTIGYVDEGHQFKAQDLTPLMEAVNRAIAGPVFISNTYAVRRDPAYDDSYLRDTTFVVAWKDPEPLMLFGSPEWEAYRESLPDWYDRIPAEGTE